MVGTHHGSAEKASDINASSCYHHDMRTTLTLEPDVSAMIERELTEKNTTLKSVINERLRRGYAAESSRQVCEIPAPMKLGKPLVANFDNIAEVLELIENDPH